MLVNKILQLFVVYKINAKNTTKQFERWGLYFILIYIRFDRFDWAIYTRTLPLACSFILIESVHERVKYTLASVGT